MPADPTDADREAAEDLLPWAPEDADGLAYRQARIAQALADERERARAPFLALAEEADARVRSSVPAAAAERLIAEGLHTVSVARIRLAAQEPTP